VQQIQNKYIELFENSLEVVIKSINSTNKTQLEKSSSSPSETNSSMILRNQQINCHKTTMQIANILLSFVQLRALDVLSKFIILN
jgi:hypothetical protein